MKGREGKEKTAKRREMKICAEEEYRGCSPGDHREGNLEM